MQKKIMIAASILLCCSTYGMENQTIVDTAERVRIGSGTLPKKYKNDIELGNIQEGPEGYPVVKKWLNERQDCLSILWGNRTGPFFNYIFDPTLSKFIYKRNFLASNIDEDNRKLKTDFIKD